MVRQNERTFLEAINYETILLAGRFSDAKAVKCFNRLRNWCDTAQSIGENLEAYSFLTGCTDKELYKAQTAVVKAFEKLDSDTLIITNTDPEWADNIKSPLFLYLKGDSSLLKEKSVSIVGTRQPSDKGVHRAKVSADVLGERFVITSGLARGIDGVAHIEALAMGYKTIAVLGTPIEMYYPPEHRELQDLIAHSGLLVSEFSPARTIQQYFFIQRNQLMSEVSDASLVVESGDNGGGVRQAKYSEKQGKNVLIFEDVYGDPDLKWPGDFSEPVVIPEAGNALEGILNPEKFRVRKQAELELK